MTRQEMFDRSTRGIIAQGGPSGYENEYYKNNFACLYRSDDGRKCAAGHLISDRAYREGMEMHAFGDEDAPVKWPAKLMKEIDFIRDIQRAHDDAAQVGQKGRRFFLRWKKLLTPVAVTYNLDPSVLSEIPT